MTTIRSTIEVAASVLLLALAAPAQSVAPPATPTVLTPPEGNAAFLKTHAVGTQGYICLPTAPGAETASWTVKGSRPEATLFQRFLGHEIQVGTHFLSPNENPNDAAPDPLPFGNATWQSAFDTSRVWAQPMPGASIPGGSHPSCPNTASIPCLLLQSVGSLPGPRGGAILSRTTFIQRLNTRAGVAPSDGCSAAADVGKQVLVPYTADYYFFRKAR
jgi:hypothetical protein